MDVDKHEELKNRTKAFALRIIKMSQALPKTREANVINNQILRSALEWRQTIELQEGLVPKQSSLPRSES